MKTLLIAAISYIAVGFLIEAPAVAEKPDGQKPASEGVCDSLQGSKPGLHELCVAYCEAQDPDGVVDPGALKHGPNQILSANYNKGMRDGDSARPCAKAPSPSRDESEFDSGAPKPAQILTV